MRRLVAAAVALTVALLLAACSPEEGYHLHEVNDFRTANHVAGLIWDEDMYPAARAWSQQMANAGALSHPASLSANFTPPPGWKLLGQNVAMAGSLDSAMTALENSPQHRENLLNPGFTRIAVGVVQQNGMYWVTEDFLG